MNEKHRQDQDDGLDRLARSLPDSAPPEELWGRIEADLREEQRRRQVAGTAWPARVAAFFRRPAVSYSLFALLLVAGSATSYLLLTTEESLDFSFFDQYSDLQLLNGADEDIDQAIHYYERAIDKLTVLAEKREPALDPEYVRLQKEKILLLRTSIDECRLALKQNRENPRVQQYLLSAYSSLQLSLEEMVERSGNDQGDPS